MKAGPSSLRVSVKCRFGPLSAGFDLFDLFFEGRFRELAVLNQKKPHTRNFSARNSGAGNDCANFMVPTKFLVLGGGGWGVGFFLKGGGECANLILWARDFSG